jgi:hypothetical protein
MVLFAGHDMSGLGIAQRAHGYQAKKRKCVIPQGMRLNIICRSKSSVAGW